MVKRTATAAWNGDLQSGDGQMAYGTFEGAFSFSSRFEDGEGTNPEELIGAAHAGCFSMALSGSLTEAGYEPERIETEATVHLDKGDDGFAITRVVLDTVGTVPGIEEDEFVELAAGAKENCPVSKALGAIDIELNASLA